MLVLALVVILDGSKDDEEDEHDAYQACAYEDRRTCGSAGETDRGRRSAPHNGRGPGARLPQGISAPSEARLSRGQSRAAVRTAARRVARLGGARDLRGR